jgi:hypothetical protein
MQRGSQHDKHLDLLIKTGRINFAGRWRNGRRCGLKIHRGNPCGFDSHPAYWNVPYKGVKQQVYPIVGGIWHAKGACFMFSNSKIQRTIQVINQITPGT